MSHLFLPSDPALKRLAAQIEEERDHALAAFTTTEPESPHERRERLRDTRRSLVAVLASSTGEARSAINARLNREVGAPSVAKSTVEQREWANALLERAVASG